MRFFISVALGTCLGVASLYVALRVGFNPGVSLLTVLCWSLINAGLYKFWQRWHPLSSGELVCYQSLTSAMSYGAGTVIATALAALILQGIAISILQATLWLTTLCVLGTLWTWPFRQQMLAHLPFPSGRAAATTVRETLTGSGKRGFVLWLSISSGWTLLREFWLSKQSLYVSVTSKMPLSLSLMLLGLGALLGRAAIDMWLGGLFFFGIPQWGIPAWLDYDVAMWLGVGILLGAGLPEPLRAIWKTSPQMGQAIDWRMSWRWWAATGLLSLLLWLCQLSIWPQSAISGAIALLLLPLFSYLACRVTGETDVVPTGGLGKLALLALGLGWPGQPQANMLVTGSLAGVSAASADFMTDLRCAEDLQVAHRRVFRFQLAGAILGPNLMVPIFFWLTSGSHQVGSEHIPAPAAQIWNRFAQIQFWELSFWQNQGRALLFGTVLGTIWAFAHKRWPRLPAPLAFATAVFLDLATVGTLALGALLVKLLHQQKRLDIFSALIAGESVAMVLFLLSL